MANERHDPMTAAVFPDGERARDYLARVGTMSDPEIELSRAALALAALERPMVGLDRYLHHLEKLAEATRAAAAAAGAEVEERAQAINKTVFDEFGYEGDTLTYDDLQNANLMRVIDRRKGLPITLSILYLHAAGSMGWPAEGINFPGHFLVRLSEGGDALIIDPFRAGRVITAAEMRDLIKQFKGPTAELTRNDYAPAGARDILIRLLNNQKLRLLEASDFAAAREVAERAVLIAPEEATGWHDAGVINAQVGNLQRAIDCLQKVSELDADARLQMQVAQLIREIRGKLH